MLKLKLLKSIIALLILSSACYINASEKPVSLKWEVGKNGAEPNHYSANFVIKNTSGKTLDNDWVIYFNSFPRRIKMPENAQIIIEEYKPNLYKMRPSSNYKPLQAGESLTVDYLCRGAFTSTCYGPDGAHFVDLANNSKVTGLDIDKPVMNNPAQWTVPGNKYTSYPDGEYVYSVNKIINPTVTKLADNAYEIFPTIKNILTTKGTTKITNIITVSSTNATKLEYNYLVEKLKRNGISVATKGTHTTISLAVDSKIGKKPSYYEIKVANNKIEIIGKDSEGVLNGVKTLIAVIEKAGKIPMNIPNATISDYPDLKHRGMMLDIARNYTKFEDIKKLIDILAGYKINVFHFHFNDDEAWRLEIPGIPELTSVGGNKGYTLTENECMMQTYAGNGNSSDLTTPANGYITRSQFIELLQYAHNRGIEIIPEIETPGHARAAIISMKARYNKYINTDVEKATQYKLWDENDKSVYTSVQGYKDNVLNVAEPGTYRFMEKVVDELDAMYKDANLKLGTVHVGGDEVPRGSWEGSPVVKDFMDKNGMTDVHEASEYFLDKVSQMISCKGISVGGWQEVALRHSKKYDAKVAPRFSGVYVWSTVGKSDTIPYAVANSGYPTVLCNVNCYYLDMIYGRHQNEVGLNWGGSVDEYKTWYSQPFNIYRSARAGWRDEPINLATASQGKPELNKPGNIVGVQAQLWAETIRGVDMVEYFTFPKIFGLVERGWNAYPSWGEDYTDMTNYNAALAKYNLQIGRSELPRLNRLNVNFRIGQPGIIIKDGKLYANTQYPDVVVRYTIDGSEPTNNSQIWTKPVPCNAKLIKAKAFYQGKESLSTFLFNE